jgi:hypothetical protein
MTVEWLLYQYIARNTLIFMSGKALVKAHKSSVFQVVEDQKLDDQHRVIAISKMKVYNDIRGRDSDSFIITHSKLHHQ